MRVLLALCTLSLASAWRHAPRAERPSGADSTGAQRSGPLTLDPVPSFNVSAYTGRWYQTYADLLEVVTFEVRRWLRGRRARGPSEAAASASAPCAPTPQKPTGAVPTRKPAASHDRVPLHPSSSQNSSVCDTADYALLANGSVSVLNRERQGSVTDGPERALNGIANCPPGPPACSVFLDGGELLVEVVVEWVGARFYAVGAAA